ncbi:MAG: type II toxin-antitoxin system HicB family antitoxin [Thermoplasmata archaeon]|nr:type II toxin-antitoxin system HicB family antitoxin [Thermoplasmata archaeon]
MDVISLPIIISREGKWYVASCPALDIATQGATEEEVKENMRELIKEYLEDPDTPKPDLEKIETTVATVIIKIDHHDKATSVASA